jgi:hypothetical protein
MITKFFDWISSWYDEKWAWAFCLFACFVFPAGIIWLSEILKTGK